MTPESLQQLPWLLQAMEAAQAKARPATPTSGAQQRATPAPASTAKVQKGWARAAAAADQQQPAQAQPPPPAQQPGAAPGYTRGQGGSPAVWGNGPAAGTTTHRPSLRALAAAQSHTANMLKAQVRPAPA